jgi:2-C-methyl-D-erythritol 4-phosphate cytidylyltransferase
MNPAQIPSDKTFSLHVLIPCAGTGSRMGQPIQQVPKQFQLLAGKPMVMHSVQTFLDMPEINSVWVGVSPDLNHPKEFISSNDPRLKISLTGGDSRHETVLQTLKAMLEAGISADDWVLVHDAARPGLTIEVARRLIQAVTEQGFVSGGILAMPMADTLKMVSPSNPECIGKTLPRDGLWLAQTPQMFRLQALSETLQEALNTKSEVTDEASAMERAGCEPLLVPGEWRNLKVTYPQDWSLMNDLLSLKNTLKKTS